MRRPLLIIQRYRSMTIQITSSAPPYNGVSCVVHELALDRNTNRFTELGTSRCSDGTYVVTHPTASHLIVLPQDGHWSMFVGIAPLRGTLVCDPIIDDINLPWWQRAVGVTANRGQNAATIRIGIIDHIFEKSAHLGHVQPADDPS